MKVCQVTSVHDATDGRVFERISSSLAKKYDVYLIAPNVADTIVNGVNIKGVNLPVDRFKRQRSLDRVYEKMIEIDADVYHFHDPELMQYGLKIKKRGKKIIFDSHENIPAQIRTKPYIPKLFRGIASKLYERYERFVFRRYDALVSVTPEIVERLKSINPNTYMLTNYPIYKEEADNRTWERKIGFAGLITSNWMLDIILNAIKDIDVTFELAGPVSGNYLEYLKSLPGWSKVNYHGVIKHDEVFEMLQPCSIGLSVASINNPNGGYNKGSLGVTKMFEYMSAGIPVLASNHLLWVPIIEGNDCGYCVNPSDISIIKEKIQYLLENPDEAKRLGDNGRRAVKEKYCWQTQEKTLFDMYNKLF